jgi:hypothetical protein
MPVSFGMAINDLALEVSHRICDEEGLLRGDMGQFAYGDLAKRIEALTKQIPAVEEIGFVRGTDRVLADQKVPAISMAPQFAWRELRPARVMRAVVARVTMTVEAQGDRIIDLIQPPL